MSFNIEFQLQPDQPKPGENMSLYANVTLFEDTRCEGYELLIKFKHPNGHVQEETRHCEALDPHNGKWHALVESFNPNETGTYSTEVTVVVDHDIKASAHHTIHIE
jgi:hypothetical protein